MAKSEAKVTVEYIIDMPDDIQVNEVDDFISNALDDLTDSKIIRSRMVTDVSFAENPGIVERYQKMEAVLEELEGMTDPSATKTADAMDIYQMVKGTLDGLE